MPALDFPNSPVEGEIYSAEGAIYTFRNGRWIILSQNEALAPNTLTGQETPP